MMPQEHGAKDPANAGASTMAQSWLRPQEGAGSRGREKEQQPMTVADKRAAAEWAVGGGGAESAPAHQPPQERRTMG